MPAAPQTQVALGCSCRPAFASRVLQGFTFFNFATRQSLGGRKLPAEAVADQAARRRPPPAPKKQAQRATASSLNLQSEREKPWKPNLRRPRANEWKKQSAKSIGLKASGLVDLSSVS